MFSLLIIMTPVANAKTSIYEAPYSMAEQITDGAAKNIKKFLSKKGKYGTLYQFATGEEKTVNANGQSYSFNKVFGNFDTVLKILGMGVAIILAFWRFFTMVEKGQDPIESILRLIFEVMIVILIILNVDRILKLITDLGDLIAQAANTGSQKKLNIPVRMLKGLGINPKKHGNTYYVRGMSWFKAVVILFIPWVLSFLVTIGGYFVVFSVLFELMLRRLFTPFAICDIYGEGLRSPGMRYLKKYLAIFIKIAVIFATCYIIGVTQAMIVPATDAGLKAFFKNMTSTIGFNLMVIALNFTGIGVMLKGGEIANDIVGA